MTRPGSDLTAVLDDPAFYAGDPFPHYARLRTEAPMAWHPEPGFWVASRHAEVMAVSRDPDLFCSAKGILTFEIGVDYGTPPTMMHTDPPDHTRYRKLVSTGFRPSIIRAFEPVVRRRVRDRLDLIEPGAAVDFTEVVAIPLAGRHAAGASHVTLTNGPAALVAPCGTTTSIPLTVTVPGARLLNTTPRLGFSSSRVPSAYSAATTIDACCPSNVNTPLTVTHVLADNTGRRSCR